MLFNNLQYLHNCNSLQYSPSRKNATLLRYQAAGHQVPNHNKHNNLLELQNPKFEYSHYYNHYNIQENSCQHQA